MRNSQLRRSIHSTEHVMLRSYLITKRKTLGLSQRDLASKMNVTRSLIGKIETGDRRLDTVEMIDYCEALEIDPHEIIDLITGL